MPTWKLTLEYDGTRYRGWQSQKNTERTVAGVLLRAARELLGEDASLGGAGRTDAGVHALAQVAHLKAKKAMPPLAIEHGLNDRLPFDVNVLEVQAAPLGFHARHDAKSRTYLYRISRRRTAFDKRYVWWVKDRLNFTAMAGAAKHFAGRHDFASFCENAAGQTSTVDRPGEMDRPALGAVSGEGSLQGLTAPRRRLARQPGDHRAGSESNTLEKVPAPVFRLGLLGISLF